MFIRARAGKVRSAEGTPRALRNSPRDPPFGLRRRFAGISGPQLQAQAAHAHAPKHLWKRSRQHLRSHGRPQLAPADEGGKGQGDANCLCSKRRHHPAASSRLKRSCATSSRRGGGLQLVVVLRRGCSRRTSVWGTEEADEEVVMLAGGFCGQEEGGHTVLLWRRLELGMPPVWYPPPLFSNDGGGDVEIERPPRRLVLLVPRSISSYLRPLLATEESRLLCMS